MFLSKKIKAAPPLADEVNSGVSIIPATASSKNLLLSNADNLDEYDQPSTSEVTSINFPHVLNAYLIYILIIQYLSNAYYSNNLFFLAYFIYIKAYCFFFSL